MIGKVASISSFTARPPPDIEIARLEFGLRLQTWKPQAECIESQVDAGELGKAFDVLIIRHGPI